MPDWLFAWLAQVQGETLRSLTAELRAGDLSALVLAAALGALHALTPGHGKSAIATYFLGREARVLTGIRMASTAALLHVFSGLVAFVILRLILARTPLITDRGSPEFNVVGYVFIIIAGGMMVAQSLRSNHSHDRSGHALAAGIGLLPCPLTVSVLGFAWLQSSAAMVALVVLSISLGIAFTIGLVAVASILFRHQLTAVLAPRLPQLERWSRVVQGIAGLMLVVFGAYALL